MSQDPISQEIKERIQEEINYFKGKLPNDVSLVWHGYLAALLDRGLIDHYAHSDLVDMLSKIDKNPAYAIFTGDPGSHLKLDNKA